MERIENGSEAVPEAPKAGSVGGHPLSGTDQHIVDMTKTPFVAVPSRVASADFFQIAECWGKTGAVEVIHGHRLPVVHLSSAGPTAPTEFAAWLIQCGPDLLKQLCVWSAAAYTGKKFVDGFATEAGKDFWHGVKSLAKLVHARWVKNEGSAAPRLSLAAVGLLTDGSPLNVSIVLPIALDVANNARDIQQFEEVLLPIIGYMASRHGRLQIKLYPRNDPPWNWHLWDHETNTLYGLNVNTRQFDLLGANSVEAPPSQACLISAGFARRVPDPASWLSRWWRRLSGSAKR